MATKLSMKDPNPGIWFKFDEADPESGEICIRPLNPEKREEIRNKTVKKKEKFKHGQRFTYEETNDDLFARLVWDYSIADWSGLVDDDGNEIVCNIENKVFFMRNHVGFAGFVSDKMAELAERYETEITIENENLLRGSDVSVTQSDRPAKTAKK